MNKERFWTIPNFLSLYRLLMFPVLAIILWQGNRQLFTALLALNLFTDILDGFIARNFNQQTKIGARLDSWADLGSYLLAYAALFRFEWEFLVAYKTGLIIFALFYVASFLTTTIRFGGIIGLHLYGCKITGYLQGGFILILLWFGNIEWLYYLMIVFGCLAKLEEIIVLLVLPAPQSDVKGLYWVLRSLKNDRASN